MTQPGRGQETVTLHTPSLCSRRTAARFPVQLPVWIDWVWGGLEATTENVSAVGILFVCRFLPEFSGPIGFTFTMPSRVLGTAKDVSVHCTGRIVRIRPLHGRTEAAAVIDDYVIEA
jgi:hypothetical protein